MLMVLTCAAALWGASPPPQAVKIWVRLADKGPQAPSRAGSRAYEDFPVYEPYVLALRGKGFFRDTRVKWQNLVSGWINPDSLRALRILPFVAKVSPMPRKARYPRDPRWRPEALAQPWRRGGPAEAGAGRPLFKSAAEDIDFGAAQGLFDSLGVDRVHAWMAREKMAPGLGVRIAVIDADFHLGNEIFRPLRSEGRIADQWDFVDGNPRAVTESLAGSHGASCLSLIGGNLPGTMVGVAPEATFFLYRAEEAAQERYVEEDFVAAAIERAVDSGAQVISISLGYR